MGDRRTKTSDLLSKFLWNKFGIPRSFENVQINSDGSYKKPKNLDIIEVGFPVELKPSLSESIFTQINSYLSYMKYNQGVDINAYSVYDSHQQKYKVKIQPLSITPKPIESYEPASP